MSRPADDGPVYYREIQKNAFLKRIPIDNSASKLRPLGNKKPPLKAMWTLFCVHNGRTPYLEQYPEPDSPCTLSHKPIWRANLRTARYVTASVKAWPGNEFDFLIATDEGPVRMLAPDWDSMQDWVTTLRNKLHELKVLSKGENVYCTPPAPPPVRAGTRDPTSPLPPTPAVPPVRVPGIELTPSTSRITVEDPEPANSPPEQVIENEVLEEERLTDRVPNWDTALQLASMPSTSQELPKTEKKIAKICGQNICLDDSILKHEKINDSDEEFFSEIDRINTEDGEIDENNQNGNDFKQLLVINSDNDSAKPSTSHSIPVANEEEDKREYDGTNITVIQVSNNRGPPHTAIPVLGPEIDIFDFEFKQKLSINDTENTKNNFVNIVNTEGNLKENRYGTVFAKNPSEGVYGHLSSTTTVQLSGSENDGLYERLCMASTSKEMSPMINKKLKIEKLKEEKMRKTSLPNLESENYEYLFPNSTDTATQNVTVNANSELQTSVIRISPGPQVPVNGAASAIERSHSQNAYDTNLRLRHLSRNHHRSPKRDDLTKNTDISGPAKPIWKRGLTELSLLSRLRGLGQGKPRNESPTRLDISARGVTSSKIVHRSRAEGRVDGSRRRSSSLTSQAGETQPSGAAGGLQSLRRRQVAALRAEQVRGSATAARLSRQDAKHEPPILCDAHGQIWVASWGRCSSWVGGRPGDRVAAIRGTRPKDAAHARQLIRQAATSPGLHTVDVLFHRVPHAKIYIVTKDSEDQIIGLKLDQECLIVSVEPNSPAAKAGIPPPGAKWAVTEVNNRTINLIKGGDEEMNRLSACGNEVSVLIQPAPLVKKLRGALKSNKTLLNVR